MSWSLERVRSRPRPGSVRRCRSRRRGYRDGTVRGAEGGPVRPEVRDGDVEFRRQPRLRQPPLRGHLTVTVAELIGLLADMPAGLPVFITNGDLPDAPVASVSVAAADYGQLVLISRDPE